jgi:hypothetical protein
VEFIGFLNRWIESPVKEARKVFFLEKKKQRNFVVFGFGFSG